MNLFRIAAYVLTDWPVMPRLASKPVPLRLPECFKAPVQPGLRARAGDQDECANNRQTPRLCGWGTWIRTRINGVRVLNSWFQHPSERFPVFFKSLKYMMLEKRPR
jgi:hypothetical protein